VTIRVGAQSTLAGNFGQDIFAQKYVRNIIKTPEFL